MRRWIGEWVETWRAAPPFSRRRRELLASLSASMGEFEEVNPPASTRDPSKEATDA